MVWFFSRGQIESHRLEWKAKPRVRSLENARHQAGGGDKKVATGRT